MSKKKRLNVGVIGTGMGRGHILGYQRIPGVKVVGVVDVDEKRGKAVAKEQKIPNSFTTHEELLAQKDLDAVSIATPNVYHTPIAIDAIKAGLHVLCEKPMATTAADAKKILKAADKADTVFMMAFNNRYRGDSQLLSQYIEAGELGEIYYGRCGWVRRRGVPGMGGWFTQKKLSGGGPLIDIGVHALDLTWWLMGCPVPQVAMGGVYHDLAKQEWERQGKPGKMDIEDLGVGMIRFENGATLVLEASWVLHTPNERFYSEVMGSKGGASLEPEFKVYQERYGELVDLTPRPPSVNGHEGEVAHFIECIRTGKQPISTATHGYHVMQMLDAIYESGRIGREVVIQNGNS